LFGREKNMYLKSLSLIVLVILLGCITGSTNASLVAQYQFEGNANDSSGNGYNGTFMGDAKTVTDAQRGQVLNLDGIDDYVDCGTGPAITGISPFTVAAWIKTSNTSHSAIVTQRDPSNNSGSYGFGLVDQGRSQIYVYDGGYGFLFQSGTGVTDGTWHHVAAVRTNSTDGELFIDGNIVATSSGTAISLQQVLVVIGRGYTGSYFFNGLMDDVRIYDNALSQEEVRQLIPEPATMLLVGLGGILLRRKR
jgi:hypothetical protein